MANLPTRMLMVVVGAGIYLGLAILGRGGIAAFFSQPALTALTAVFTVLCTAAPFAGGNLSSGVREDRENRWVIAVFSLIGLLQAFLPAWSDRKGIWIIDGDAARWLGVILFAAGGAMRIWPVFVLGTRLSGLVAIQPGHPLATSGIYRIIRHPSYLGLLVASLGWGLAFRSGVGVLLAALLIPPLAARIQAEERLLRSEFGAEYDTYRGRTSRLIPGLY
jgi:protein-S-isoprenylcysteine O-methyltransferase Ste14